MSLRWRIVFITLIVIGGILGVNTRADADPWGPPPDCIVVQIPDGVGCPEVPGDCLTDPGQPSCFPRANYEPGIKCAFIMWVTWTPCQLWGGPW